jgi:hypothetical protein
MVNSSIVGGVAHELPADLRNALAGNPTALAAWESLTPLARNEWICWTVFVKKADTRADHVRRVVTELNEGIRRPCCWLGCTHRTDKAVSPSVQAMLDRRSKGKRNVAQPKR